MSNRYVWPYLFSLRAGSLNSAASLKTFAEAKAKYFSGSSDAAPVALRWSTASLLGFPRQPFQLYRRRRGGIESEAFVSVLAAAVTVTAPAVSTLSVFPVGDAAYVVYVSCAAAATDAITLQALDVNGNVLPNQSIVTNSNSAVVAQFRCPGIGYIRATGSGTISHISAISETAYANLADWTIIQTVGLPFTNNEIGAAYDTTPQGIWISPTIPPTTDGVGAANVRTLLTTLVEQPPPNTGIADFPLPAWPAPNASAYVANLRSSANLLPMIGRCLQHSSDTNPNNQQSSYSETITTSGLSQIGAAVPASGSPSQVTVSIVDIVLLAATIDCYASVALGYGTLDIPPNPTSITVTVSPASASIPVFGSGKPSGSVQFTATVTGTTNNTVVWGVNGIAGGNSTVGTISTTGLYSGPAAVPTPNSVTVSATSQQDATRYATATVTINHITIDPPIVNKPVLAAPVILNPAPVSNLASSTTLLQAATVTPGSPDITPPESFIFLPPQLHTTVDNYGDFDYMVTAPFVLALGSAPGTTTFNATLAALSTGQLPVTGPLGLAATVIQSNVPLARDQAAPASINLTWETATDPQEYAILVSRAANQSQWLNEIRPAAVGGYEAFLGLAPYNLDPNTPPVNQQPIFTDLAAALPLTTPPVTDRYLVAAQDVFGQRSSWQQASATLSPAGITRPTIINAEFLYSANPGNPVIPATLRIDFGWDWEDRAPGEIRFTAQFVPAPATSLNPPYLGGFAMKNSGTPGTPVILTFSYGALNPDTVAPTQIIPTITSGHASNGPVSILGSGSPPTPATSNQVQYRVELTGLQLDFSSSNELDFLIFATATEQIRPGIWSDPTYQPVSLGSPAPPPLVIGKIVRSINPNPPIVTFTPPPISWTALPDATGTARGVLQWPAAPGAAGYYVWEATESALLHILAPGTPDPDPATPFPERAASLLSLLNANQDASLQGFSRLNNQPITATSTELTLPGAASTLYCYRISAIGQNNVESSRSAAVAFFAVPRRNVPGAPRLMLRNLAGSPAAQLQVVALAPSSSMSPPSGYRLFRARNYQNSANATAMGPAKYDENSPLWRPYSAPSLSGQSLREGKYIVDPDALTSWYPYYYRATCIGATDPTNGVFSGESAYSSPQTAYVLPNNPPLISSLPPSSNAHAALFTLTTDLPADAPSPVGPALIELLQIVKLGGKPTPVVQTSVASNLVPVESLSLTVASPPTIQFARSVTSPDGTWKLFILLPYSPSEAGNFIVRLTDPLARQSTVSF